MKCVFCGNKVAKDTQTIERRIQNQRVYINNVPVELCKSCGEVYIDDSIVSEMNQILESLKRKEISNTLIVDFSVLKEQSATNLDEFSGFKQLEKLVTA